MEASLPPVRSFLPASSEKECRMARIAALRVRRARTREARADKTAPAAVLIIDGDGPLGEVLADLLQECGYPVRTAISGREATLTLSNGTEQPGLILLNNQAPALD